MTGVKGAIHILGQDRIVTYSQSNAVVLPYAHMQAVPAQLQINYTIQELDTAARRNADGVGDYYLVYCHQLSLLDLHRIFGDDSNWTELGKRTYFSKWQSLWQAPSEKYWANQSFSADYYLIDFFGRWRRMTWREQKERIKKYSGDCYLYVHARAPECLVAQALFLIFKIYDRRLLENWSHWGPSRDSLGRRVAVGKFSERGLVVTSESPSWNCRDDLRVCLWRQPISVVHS